MPDAMVEQIGNTLSYPFVQAGSMAGQTENNIKNNEVPVPMWLVDAADSSKIMQRLQNTGSRRMEQNRAHRTLMRRKFMRMKQLVSG